MKTVAPVTVSGTTVTVGSTTTILDTENGIARTDSSLAVFDYTHAIAIWKTSTSRARGALLTLDGATVTAGTATQFRTDPATISYPNIDTFSATYALYCFKDSDAAISVGTCAVVTRSGTSLTLSSETAITSVAPGAPEMG